MADGRELPVAALEAGEEESDFPNLRQLAQDVKVRISEPFDLERLPSRSNLLSISNRSRMLAAGTSDGVILTSLASVRDFFKSDIKRGETPRLSSPLRVLKLPSALQPGSPHFVTFANEDAVVAVGSAQGSIALWDVSVEARHPSFAEPTVIPAPPSSFIIDIRPNPEANPELAAVLFGEEEKRHDESAGGQVSILDVNQKTMVATFGEDVTTMCWSVKGKQLVCGTRSGTLVQYSPNGKAQGSIGKAPTLADGAYFVGDVNWLENDVFVVTYQLPSGSPSEPDHDYKMFAIVRERNTRITYVELSIDPAPAFGLMERSGKRFSVSLKGWAPTKHLLFVANAPSTDVGVVSCKADSPLTEAWATLSLPETSRATLPFSSVDDSVDTGPIGLGVDLTNPEPVPASDADQAPTMPAPTLMVYTTDGVILAYHVLNPSGVQYPGMLLDHGKDEGQAASTLGVPSPLGTTQAKPPAFGTASPLVAAQAKSPAFGSPSPLGAAPAKPTFGSPSPLRASQSEASGDGIVGESTSPFGSIKPGLGFGSFSSKPSAFGSPSTLGAAQDKPSTFGSPSPLGAAQAKPPAFGSPSPLTASQSEASSSDSVKAGLGFGSFSSKPSAFGSLSPLDAAQDKPPAFGSPSPLGAGPAKPPFGFPSPLSASQSGASGDGIVGESTSPFGSLKPGLGFGSFSSKPSAFGSPSTLGAAQDKPSTFGSPSPLGAAQAKPPAFGSPSPLTASQSEASSSDSVKAGLGFGSFSSKPSAFGFSSSSGASQSEASGSSAKTSFSFGSFDKKPPAFGSASSGFGAFATPKPSGDGAITTSTPASEPKAATGSAFAASSAPSPSPFPATSGFGKLESAFGSLSTGAWSEAPSTAVKPASSTPDVFSLSTTPTASKVAPSTPDSTPPPTLTSVAGNVFSASSAPSPSPFPAASESGKLESAFGSLSTGASSEAPSTAVKAAPSTPDVFSLPTTSTASKAAPPTSGLPPPLTSSTAVKAVPPTSDARPPTTSTAVKAAPPTSVASPSPKSAAVSGIADEFQRAIDVMENELRTLSINIKTCKDFVGRVGGPSSDVQPTGKPSIKGPGDLDALRGLTRSLTEEVVRLQTETSAQRRNIRNLHSMMVKAEAKREEVGRILKLSAGGNSVDGASEGLTD